jgi:outer membrane protein insertion porin family
VTRTPVIVRETRLRRGELYRQSKIDGAQQQLQRLGFFSKVSPLSIASVRGDTVDLTVDLEEGKTNSINGVIGYTPEQNNRKGYLTGLVDLSLANLFGTGRQIDVLWHRRDPYSSNLAFGYTEPWILGTPLRVDGHLEQIDQDSTYIQTMAWVGLSTDLTDHLSGGLRFAWERVVPDSGGGTFLARSTTYTAGARAEYDTRNNPSNPRHGLYYRTSADYGRKRNRATASFTPQRPKVRTAKFTLDLEHFIPIALHGREFRSGEKPVPVAEHFRLGGATTLRGYREDQFTGTRLAWANVEYRYLVTPMSRMFLFIDMGSYFREQIDPGTNTLNVVDRYKFGYGLGFRLQSKVGIIGLDFGLGEGDSFSQGKIHIRMENKF